MFPALSRQYASQLLFEVTFSRIYQNIIYVCATLSVISVFLANINNIALNFFSLFFLIFICIIAIRNNCSRTIQWQPDGRWLIVENNIKSVAELRAGSIVTSFFSVLNFKLDNNKKLNVVLFKDNINAEKFRQLRVRMKVEGIQLKEHVKLN